MTTASQGTEWQPVRVLAEQLQAELAPDLEGEEREFWIFRRERWIESVAEISRLTDALITLTRRRPSLGHSERPWMSYPLPNGGALEIFADEPLLPAEGAVILRKMADSLHKEA